MPSANEQEQQPTPIIVGISLGTGYSSISIISKDGKGGEPIANEDGDRQIPSYVAFSAHEVLCGTQAAQQAMANPRGTIFQFRNLLGKKFDDKEVQQQSRKHPFSIVPSPQDPTVPVYEVTLTDDNGDERTEYHSVIEVTAMYLRKLKETAEYFLSKKVDGCVISIPPHFEDAQKADLLAAAKDAGFESAYPLHEPVAAALAFQYASENIAASQQQLQQQQEESKSTKRTLVLDLGAQQFNVTLLNIHDGLYTIESSVDEPELGGISFNEVLVDYIRQTFEAKTKATISDNRRAMQKVRNACERTKRALTRQDAAPCSIESLYDGMDFHGSVNRGRFELLAEPLLNRCKETVGKVLSAAKLSIEQIDEVLAVGGSSRMPRFISIMKSLLGGASSFRVDVEPDEAISVGCAVQAAIIINNSSLDYAALSVDDDVVLADRLSKNIGIEVAGGAFAVLLPKGTPIPVHRVFAFGLSAAGQTEAYVALYEGDSDVARKNAVLVEAVVSDLPENTFDVNGAIEVTVTIEKDHSLSLSASEKVSGKKVKCRLHK
ncbi:heat shock protein 70 family [Entophlyctis helioformis]|nr:heat shock protein 70 family [Entophlyctis helioformis]